MAEGSRGVPFQACPGPCSPLHARQPWISGRHRSTHAVADTQIVGKPASGLPSRKVPTGPRPNAAEQPCNRPPRITAARSAP